MELLALKNYHAITTSEWYVKLPKFHYNWYSDELAILNFLLFTIVYTVQDCVCFKEIISESISWSSLRPVKNDEWKFEMKLEKQPAVFTFSMKKKVSKVQTSQTADATLIFLFLLLLYYSSQKI